MLVTINTDASFSNTHNVATYAFWIACDKGKFFRSGELKGSVFTSTHAEMKCIINALYFVFDNAELREAKKIIVNTDSLISIEKFKKNKKVWGKSKKVFIKEELDIIKEQFNKILDLHIFKKNKKNVVVEYRHVKAHEHVNNAKHFINDLCDREAKVQMGIVLKKLKK
jgi:ribonuclease HI